MAKYKVQSINYIISGRKEKILNLDIIKCEYPAYDLLLQKESELSTVIETEHGQYGLSTWLQEEHPDLENRNDIFTEGEAGMEAKDQIILHPFIETVKTNVIEVQTKENVLNKAYNSTIVPEPNKTFVLDIEDSESFDADCYKHGFMNDDGVIIHPMYDIKDLALRCPVMKSNANGSDQNLDVYAPAMDQDPIEFCQCESYAYGIMVESQRKPYTNTTNLLQQRKELKKKEVTRYSYQYGLSSIYTDTYLYKSLSDLIDANNQVPTSYQQYFDSYRAIGLSAYALSTILKPDVDLSCISYNTLLEVPIDMDKYNDYDAGEIQADTLEGKNSYDPLYSMRMSSKTKLDKARKYCGIGQCGGKIFLKYRDNIQYTGQEPVDNGEIKFSKMLSGTSMPNGYYQKIEVLESIDRFESPIKHKSNMFSLEIADSGINTLPEDKKIQLQQDIKNNIRQLVGILAPANTQLFDIYFTGK